MVKKNVLCKPRLFDARYAHIEQKDYVKRIVMGMLVDCTLLGLVLGLIFVIVG
ncbi:MAG: hypothetical protein QME81_14350 [bacterium]|nr:hypothetical protein [bacterium]